MNSFEIILMVTIIVVGPVFGVLAFLTWVGDELVDRVPALRRMAERMARRQRGE